MFLLESTPRELCFNGKRIKIANSLKDITTFINRNNGKGNLFTSVYSFEAINNNKGIYDSAVVDKIFLDFDIKDINGNVIDAYANMRKIAVWLYDNKILFSCNFSGRGYHILLYTKKEFLNNKKQAITNFVNKLLITHNLTNGEVDPHLIGNLAGEIRLLNTINLKSGLYCVPLTLEDIFSQNEKNIKIKAMKKQKLFSNIHLFGKNLISLKNYDSDINSDMKNYSFNNNNNSNINISNKIIFSNQTKNVINFEKFKESIKDIPCLNNVVNNKEAGYEERKLLLAYLHSHAFSEWESYNIMKSFLSEDKWKKSSCARNNTHDWYKWKKENSMMISCNKINSINLCPLKNRLKSCKYYNKLDK